MTAEETTIQERNLAVVRGYLEAIEAGAEGETLAAFFTDDVIQEEFPNRLVSDGARRDLAGLQEAAVRGAKVIRGQRYQVRTMVAMGDCVAVEAVWTGTLMIPFGSLGIGDEMRANIAFFVELRDGRIAAQRSYDCFQPW